MFVAIMNRTTTALQDVNALSKRNFSAIQFKQKWKKKS